MRRTKMPITRRPSELRSCSAPTSTPTTHRLQGSRMTTVRCWRRARSEERRSRGPRRRRGTVVVIEWVPSPRRRRVNTAVICVAERSLVATRSSLIGFVIILRLSYCSQQQVFLKQNFEINSVEYALTRNIFIYLFVTTQQKDQRPLTLSVKVQEVISTCNMLL